MDYNKFNIEEKYDSYKNITEQEAKNILEKLEEQNDYEDSYDYHILKGKMLLKIGNKDEAIEELRDALLYGTTDEVYDLLSFAYYEKREYELALYYIDLSFGINVDEYIYNHKGKVLEELGKFEECFETYYNGLKFALGTYSSYGDVEIFGENVARIGGLLKNKYVVAIKQFIKDGDFYSLYEYYMKLMRVIAKEEENDHYHSVNEYVEFKYLELIEEGKYILIDNDCYLEMVNIYKSLYDIEKNSEYDDKEYINKEYIDNKVKQLVEDLVERTSLQYDVELILNVLDEVIKLKNKDYYGYLYHKGYISMKLKEYTKGMEVLNEVIVAEKCDYIIKIQSYECIIRSLEREEEYSKIKEEYKKNLTETLKSEIERIRNNNYELLDEKFRMIFQNCKRAINLKLNPVFWDKYMEELYLEFGEKYEIIAKNQSVYKIIENYNKAIDIYDKLISLKPNDGKGYYRKGRAIVLVLRLLNSSKTSIKDLGGLHNLDCFTYSEVIYNLTKAIELNSRNSKYFNLLARTHFEIGEYEKAYNYMERALKLSPNELFINLNMVCILIRRNQYTEAVDYLFKMSYKDMEEGKVTKSFLPKREILSFLMGIFNLYQRQDKIYYIIAYYFYAIEDFKFNKSITFINNAISAVDDERYYLLRSKIYFKAEKYEEALKSAEEAIVIDEHYDEAFLVREQCQKKVSV